jgi:hypothetical protein
MKPLVTLAANSLATLTPLAGTALANASRPVSKNSGTVSELEALLLSFLLPGTAVAPPSWTLLAFDEEDDLDDDGDDDLDDDDDFDDDDFDDDDFDDDDEGETETEDFEEEEEADDEWEEEEFDFEDDDEWEDDGDD